jgi:hypothetical protein
MFGRCCGRVGVVGAAGGTLSVEALQGRGAIRGLRSRKLSKAGGQAGQVPFAHFPKHQRENPVTAALPGWVGGLLGIGVKGLAAGAA